MLKNLAYLAALHAVEGLGNVRLRRLVDVFENPETIWQTDPRQFIELGIPKQVAANIKEAGRKTDPDQYYRKIEKAGIQILTCFDRDFPSSLKQLSDPPVIIYYFGEFEPRDCQAIAVVGTRKVTGYGRLVTDNFVTELAAKNLTIVSGLANGVDTVAHRSALAAGGRTIAVLGGGFGLEPGNWQIFPPENTRLAQEIAGGSGVVMTEFPPGYPALSGNFPVRNRIVAGLALGVLVTEAAEDSGSLITARLAAETGKDVFAVPGPITSGFSRGTSQLIREGASLVMGPDEVLDILGVKVQQPVVTEEDLDKLSEIERRILDNLQNEQKHIDELCRELGLKSPEVSANLIKLEFAGLVKNLGSGVYAGTNL